MARCVSNPPKWRIPPQSKTSSGETSACNKIGLSLAYRLTSTCEDEWHYRRRGLIFRNGRTQECFLTGTPPTIARDDGRYHRIQEFDFVGWASWGESSLGGVPPTFVRGVDGVTTGEDSTLMRQAQNSKDSRALSRWGAYRLGMGRWMGLPPTRTHSGEMLRLRRCSLIGTLVSLTCGSGQYHLRCKANAGKELKNSLIGTLCGRRRRMLILPFPRSIAQMKLPTISLTGRLYFFGRTSLILPRNHQTRYQF
jgi:hypothetical protein